MPTSTWTDTRVETLGRLWREGQSASQIARVLAGGVTRNAVIGKIHRLGLGGREAPAKPSRARPTARPAAASPRRAWTAASAAAPPTAAPTPAEERVAFGDAGRGQCRWPLGDPKEEGFGVCGRPRSRGAYCRDHAAVAYRPANRRPPRDHLLKLAGLA